MSLQWRNGVYIINDWGQTDVPACASNHIEPFLYNINEHDLVFYYNKLNNANRKVKASTKSTYGLLFAMGAF